MRSTRLAYVFFLLVSFPVWAQQVAAPQASRDPQAVSILNQVLTVAGGTPAITAITDYSATGNITYNNDPNQQGSVTLHGLGLIAFRLDANLPAGVRSLAIDQGKITQKAEDGTVSKPHTQAPMFPGSFALPYLHLANALRNPSFSIAYEGLLQIDGHSVHKIRVQRVLPPGADPYGLTTVFHTREFFIDATTYQVIETQEPFGSKRVMRRVHYSDYTVVNSILVPFSISELLFGVQSLAIHLDQITFNTGLQESAIVF